MPPESSKTDNFHEYLTTGAWGTLAVAAAGMALEIDHASKGTPDFSVAAYAVSGMAYLVWHVRVSAKDSFEN